MKNKGNEIIDADNSTSLYKKMKAIVWTKYGPPDVLQLRGRKTYFSVFSKA